MELHTLETLGMAEPHAFPPILDALHSRGRNLEVFTSCHRLLGGAYQDGHLSASRFYRYLSLFVSTKDGTEIRMQPVDDRWVVSGNVIEADDSLVADGIYVIGFPQDERISLRFPACSI
jgi:hypothetical protein